jgi:hypothetical protein
MGSGERNDGVALNARPAPAAPEPLDLSAPRTVRSGQMQLARWISIVAHPFVMIAVMVGASTARVGRASEVGANIAWVSVFTCVPVAFLIVWKVRRGVWVNVDASRSQERPALYFVGVSGVVLLVLSLVVLRPDSFLLRGAVTALGLLVVCAVATRWIKVSLHMAAASLTATGLILLPSPVGWGVAVFLPLLAWSRLALARHRPVELACGLALGMAAGFALHLV